MGEIKFPFYAKLSLTLVAVVLIIFLLSAGSSVFIPLFSAFLVAVLLLPIAKFLETLKIGRGLASFICVLLFIGFLASFIYFLILQIISFTHDMPQFQTRIQELFVRLQQWVEEEFHVNSSDQIAYLNKSVSTLLNNIANSAGNIFLSIVTFVIWTIFIFVYTFFMLFHRKLLLRFILGLFKPHQQSQVMEVITNTRSMINHYVLGLLTEMVIMMFLNSTVFALLGIKYAILLGTIAAVLNIIPYLGIYTAMAIGMVVTIANGTGNQALALGISLIIIHFIDANILLPRIVGGRVKMNPLITIVAVLTGGRIWGIPGMFLFIPLTAIVKIIFERVHSLKPWSILIGTEDDPDL